MSLKAAIDARESKTKTVEDVVFVTKPDEEEASALRQMQVIERQKDIRLVDALLCSIGFAPSDAGKLAETLVLDHKIGSTIKFQKKVGGDLAGYCSRLQLDTDDAELLDEYFQSIKVSTPFQPLPHLLPITGDASTLAGDDTGATAVRHWDCFMTHNRGINDSNHLKVSRINDALKSNSLVTWFNEDKHIYDGKVQTHSLTHSLIHSLTQSLTHSLIQRQAAEGVENSSAIIVFITEAYHQKVNNGDSCDSCHYEFDYSLNKKGAKLMVPVVMEEAMCNQCSWEGTLSAALGSSSYIDFSGAFNDDIIFHQKMKELIARVSFILP